jgi:hypothetical protein
MEAEHRDIAVPADPHRLEAITTPDRVRCVLDDLESVFGGQSMDLVHLARLAGQMYRNDDLRQSIGLARRDQFFLEAFGAHVVRARIDVHEIHARPAVERAVRARDERDGARPHQITRTNPECHAGDVQRARGTVRRHGVTRFALRADRMLERRNRGALRQQVGPQHLHHCLDVGV